MTKERLAYLNRLLQDHLGTTAAGGPLYKWFHSRDPEMFCYIGRLLSSGGVRAEYDRVPQVTTPPELERRWVLGMWMAPPSPEAWEAMYQGQVGYPRGGYWVACSTPSDPLFDKGVEPNERITMYAIQLRKKQIALGLRGVYEAYRARQEYHKREEEQVIDDALTDRWTNCEPHVPGASAEVFA